MTSSSCPECGNEIQENHLYCRSCGAIPNLDGNGSRPSVSNSLQKTLNSAVITKEAIPSMTMDRDNKNEINVLYCDKTFSLMTEDKKDKVIESGFCCLPIIPCCVCVCSELKVVPANHNGEAITVHYNRDTKTLRHVDRRGQYIITEWDESKVGTNITSWGCWGCPAAAHKHQWNLMSDGSLQYLNGDVVAFGKVDESSERHDPPVLVKIDSFNT
eukprot:CAMPEP_0194124156 /NCGR_PEP_ID=MMETSP0150-20130528/57445_1 /TAXON_ID=122233 /ORGANISM="Chaetoceros debilis, Strain MM31A-1" /LENGTH=214 /DNA_ID=CAMNT_0038817743 /DNA_START=102 /DNA_END=743 /DNA_ORIENTATION=-